MNMKRLSIFMIACILQALMAVTAQAAAITRILPVSNGTTTVISWQNPVVSGITKLDIIDENGYSVIEGQTPSIGSGSIASASVTGLTVGTAYQYTIVCYLSDNSTITGDVSFTPITNAMWYSQDGFMYGDLWNSKLEGLNDLVGGWFDGEVKYSGSYSYRLSSNTTALSHAVFYLGFAKGSYEISCKAKVKDLVAGGNVWIMNDWVGDTKRSITGDTWQTYSYTVTNTDSSVFRIGTEGICAGLWVDDICVRTLENGVATGDNVLGYNIFSFDAANLQLNDKTLSWSLPGTNKISAQNVYKRSLSGVLTKLNSTELTASATSFTLPEQTQANQSYSLVVKAMLMGKETPGTAYNVTGSVDLYDFELARDAATITALEPGVLTVTQKIKNNTMGDQYKAELILALYNDDELVKLVTSSKTIPQTNAGVEPESVSAQITVPEISGGDYQLQVFLWDGIDEMNSLKDFQIYK